MMRRTLPGALCSALAPLTPRPQLTDQLQQATTENIALHAHVTALEDDLAAARTSLRRMIRDENLNQ
ncbi:hypothetical protein [Streptomyces sp. NBC_01262]|uniref:hypothetical protein n=1 Tax=Streptomyces sp. NBC_01262 TaxID=2903803 RepID=UPI002E36D5FD|nr:hypothetical protein [Streptomyces sp. NBC_01262]